MVKSNFFEILKSLNKSELKRMELLIRSPYYNNNSNVTKLFMYVKKFYPEFNHEKLEKEVVWNGLFNGRKFNYGIMKNLIYELNKHAEKFLELQEYEKNEFESGLNLINQLRQRFLRSRFEKTLKLYKDRISRFKISSDYYYYNHLTGNVQPINYNDLHKSKYFGNINNQNIYLFSYFFSNYFWQNMHELLYSKTYSLHHETKDLESVLEFFEKNNFGKEPLTMMYYYSFKLILYPEEEDTYFDLKRLFLKNFDKLDRLTKYNMGSASTSYWIIQKMKGSAKFDAEHFEIIKLMLKHDFYISDESQYMDTGLYGHIITLANGLGHTTWCKEFINEYHDKLNPEDKNNIYYFGMYIINKTENKIDDALLCLSKIKPKNVMEKITVKRLEIQVYYDLGYFVEVYSLIKNCKEYIKHDSSSSELSKIRFNDFLYSIKKLVDINLEQNPDKYDERYFEELKKDITDRKFISKSWVLNKLQILEKSAK